MPKTRRKPPLPHGRGSEAAEPRASASGLPPAKQKPASSRYLWIYLLLLLATCAVYAPVRQFDFVNYDDPEYVVRNLYVHAGITPQSVQWAFTSRDSANWFPVTRLSHMLDDQLFGLQSGLHHVANLLFHAAATLLLFAFLLRSTSAPWPSAFVAFLFALHPLHVESVAWVSERKDVLSAFFWFLSLWAYVRYAERPALGRYLLTWLSFCLGLMAKPMMVTLPFVLLLVDVWPLGRLPVRSPAGWRKMVWEKLPFFALSAGVATATYLVQRGSGAVKALNAFPLGLRLENALLSYVVYIGKMLWPTKLAVFYPYPPDIPAWQAILSGVAIAGISALAWRWFRFFPYLAVGWLWYLGTLVPVIGLVQVGTQARADRYTYIPMTGLLIILAWGAADVVRKWPRAGPAMIVLAAAACLSCVALTSVQIQYWKNSESLFQHAIDVTDANYVAQHNLGDYLTNRPGRLAEAITHLQAALRINPGSMQAHTDLGTALSKNPDRLPEAVAEYQAALRIDPDSPITHNDLGNTLSKIPGRLPEAIAEYEIALRMKPDFAEAHNNLGSAFAGMDQLSKAITEYQTALRIDPDYAKARNNLASVLAERDSAEAHYNSGVALLKTTDRVPEAIEQFETALRMKPDFAEAHNDLGVALSQTRSRLPEAIQQFRAAVRIRPDYADAQYNLGMALSQMPGGLPEAIAHLKAALRIEPNPQVQKQLEQLQAARR